MRILTLATGLAIGEIQEVNRETRSSRIYWTTKVSTDLLNFRTAMFQPLIIAEEWSPGEVEWLSGPHHAWL